MRRCSRAVPFLHVEPGRSIIAPPALEHRRFGELVLTGVIRRVRRTDVPELETLVEMAVAPWLPGLLARRAPPLSSDERAEVRRAISGAGRPGWRARGASPRGSPASG